MVKSNCGCTIWQRFFFSTHPFKPWGSYQIWLCSNRTVFHPLLSFGRPLLGHRGCQSHLSETFTRHTLHNMATLLGLAALPHLVCNQWRDLYLACSTALLNIWGLKHVTLITLKERRMIWCEDTKSQRLQQTCVRFPCQELSRECHHLHDWWTAATAACSS